MPIRALFRWRKTIWAVVGSGATGLPNHRGATPLLVRLTKSANTYQAMPETHFPAPVLGIYGDEKRLIVLLEESGAVDLTDPQKPRWLGCETQIREQKK